MSYLDNYQTGMVEDSSGVLSKITKLREEEIATRVAFKCYLSKFKENIEHYIFTYFLKLDKQTNPRLYDLYKRENQTIWILWFTDDAHSDTSEDFFLEISEQDLILAINTEIPKWR